MTEPSLSDIMRSLNNIDKKIENEVNSLRTDLGKSISDQVATLESSFKRSIDDAIIPIAKRQDDMEIKSDKRFKVMEEKIDKRFKVLEHTVQSLSNSLSEVIATKSSTNNQSSSTPHQYQTWPQTYAEASCLPPPSHPACLTSPSNSDTSTTGESSAIAELIGEARRVIGIGPVSQMDIDYFARDNPEDAVRLAAIEALRCDLNIKEDEIKDVDIENTFLPPKATKIPRVYVRFYKQEHADLCLKAAKSLKNSETKVFRYFPRQFQARVRALEEVAYPMRKQQDPGYKTEVVFTATDVQLLVCPRGLTRYQPYQVPHLPPIDMAPIRSPPPGRQRHKRNRSGTPSPEAPSKSTRYQPPTPPNKEPENCSVGQSDKHPEVTRADVVPANLSPPDKTLPTLTALPDLGGVASMEVISPRTGRLSFNFQDPVNLRRQSGNF